MKLSAFSPTLALTVTICALSSSPAHAAPDVISVKGQAVRNSASAARRETDVSLPPFVPGLATPGGTPHTPSVTTPEAVGKNNYLFSLHFKPIVATGETLADNGVYLTGWNFAELGNVVKGGLNHGSFVNDYFAIGADLDLKRIAGIPGASIHLLTNEVAGQGRAGNFTGATWGYVSYWGNHDGYQLRELTWDQMLWKNRIGILAGRSNPKGGEFNGSDIYCMFPTFLCSVPGTVTINGSLSSFVTSTWGFRLLLKPTPATYIKGGIWETDPTLKLPTHGGWPGPDWGFNKARGEYMPFEAGYRTNFTNDRYPRAYDVGAVYDTAIYNDPFYNTQGRSRALYGGAAQPRRGRVTAYMQAQQMVWKPDPKGTRGVILFAAVDIGAVGNAPVRDGVLVGAFDWGPFRQRPRDYTGFVIQTYRWDHSLVRGMNDGFVKRGLRNQFPSTETLMEINYGAAVAPGIMFVPYMEYIWNPDQMGHAHVRPNLDTAMQIGCSLNVQFNPALGLPLMHRVRQ